MADSPSPEEPRSASGPPTATLAPPGPQGRLSSLDAYRGFVMFLMVAEVLHLCRVAGDGGGAIWEYLCYHQSHVAWVGCTLHDLIQPSFSFIVGVALPFSIAARLGRGQSQGRLIAHAFWRALILILLGIFLRSLHRSQTNFTFEDTLTQIGLGYGFLFMLGLRPRREHGIALGVLLFGYWLAFALYPAPGPGFDYSTVGVANDWPHLFSGFWAHWNKNTNLAAAFDVWFMNLFPRPEPFAYNGGGYQTLSFIPTLGTMILGLIAGGILRAEGEPRDRLRRLALWAAACGVGGWLLHVLGICPMVKRIWTPSFALFSGGFCFLLLAAFYWVIEMRSWRRWSFPLVVIGMNSIAIYVMSWTMEDFVDEAIRTHLGAGFLTMFGERYAPLVSGAGVILVFWGILYWMYRRKLFLRI